MRLLALLLDETGLRAWRDRLVLGTLALLLALIGVGWLLAAGFRALVLWAGKLDADLIFGALFLLMALFSWVVARYRWRRRPRSAQTTALLVVFAEGLALMRSLMRKDPVALMLVALILGTLRSMLSKGNSDAD